MDEAIALFSTIIYLFLLLSIAIGMFLVAHSSELSLVSHVVLCMLYRKILGAT